VLQLSDQAVAALKAAGGRRWRHVAEALLERFAPTLARNSASRLRATGATLPHLKDH
jgi:hypothetical protein